MNRQDLCTTCREIYDGYDTYRGPRTVKLAQSGNPLYNVPQRQRDRETALSQQKVILNICERNHNKEND